MATGSTRQFSVPVIRRLPEYFAYIEASARSGMETISSTAIAEHLNIDSITVRKDLQSIGAVGRPKIGFRIDELLMVINEFMGWGRLDELIIAGCGDLGSALMGYKGFVRREFKIVAGFDVDPVKAGTEIHGIPVFPTSKMGNLISRLHIDIGIIATPPEAAQAVADEMVNAGIRGIWNFSPAALKVAKQVVVQQEDLTASLVILQKSIVQRSQLRRSSDTGKGAEETPARSE